MPISSLIVRTKKEFTEKITEKINIIKEATVSEVHNNNLIVITETDAQSQDKDLWKEIEAIPGVLQCDLIYHNFEDDPASHNN